ncbi:hypothetical protein XENOCAPTIV_014931 [Xenoophorus captivus]|uniref:Serpin domain-containing protein n=1 Tax=Xenoophorus captivus TaxID=1517983 RepID=A0ABV0R8S1_9TELE
MTLFILLPLASLFLTLLMSPAGSQIISPGVEDLMNRNADFGARLYRAVASRTDDNVFLSPFAVSTGMLALVSGTSGPTQNELLHGLTLTGLDPQTMPGRLGLSTGDGDPEKDVIYLFKWVLDLNCFSSVSRSVSYSEEHGSSNKSIHELSAGHGGLPRSEFSGACILPGSGSDEIWGKGSESFYPPTQRSLFWKSQKECSTSWWLLLFVLNKVLLCVSVRFSPPFNSTFTQNERFYVDRYHVVMVPMMFRADKYFLAYDRSVKAGVLKLPMADGAAMLVVLPDEDVDVTAVEEDVTSEKIQAWIRQLKKT